MDLDSFLVSLYVLVDDWWQAGHGRAPRRPGRPALLTDPEVITLAILALSGWGDAELPRIPFSRTS